MKFVISKVELVSLVSKIQNIIPQKSTTIPVLSNFLIEAANGMITFTATDLTVSIKCSAKAKILEEGSTTQPARRFFSLVKELTDDTIEMLVDDNDISKIVAGESDFKLHGMSSSEFPALPEFKETVQFKVTQKDLKNLMFKSSFAISRDDSRYVLTGVLMRFSEGKVCCVGTDGKRLAKVEHNVDIDSSFSCDYILPLKAVDEVERLLQDDEDEEATVYLIDDKVAFKVDNTVVLTKLIDGKYPDFNRVIPEETEITIFLQREELITLLRQVYLFTTEESGHSVKFTFNSGSLTLTANTANIGAGEVSMPINYEGEKMEAAFNAIFFLDILRHTKDETVTLKMADQDNPGVITDSSSALFVIMPMRLNVPQTAEV